MRTGKGVDPCRPRSGVGCCCAMPGELTAGWRDGANQRGLGAADGQCFGAVECMGHVAGVTPIDSLTMSKRHHKGAPFPGGTAPGTRFSRPPQQDATPKLTCVQILRATAPLLWDHGGPACSRHAHSMSSAPVFPPAAPAPGLSCQGVLLPHGRCADAKCVPRPHQLPWCRARQLGRRRAKRLGGGWLLEGCRGCGGAGDGGRAAPVLHIQQHSRHLGSARCAGSRMVESRG